MGILTITGIKRIQSPIQLFDGRQRNRRMATLKLQNNVGGGGGGGLRVDMSVINLFYCSNEVSCFSYLTCLLINVIFSWKCVVNTCKGGHALIIGMPRYFSDWLEFHQSSPCRFS